MRLFWARKKCIFFNNIERCQTRVDQNRPTSSNFNSRLYGRSYGYPKYPHKIWGPSAPPIFCGGASKFYYIAIVLKTRVKWRVMQISYLQQQFCAQLFLGTHRKYPKIVE